MATNLFTFHIEFDKTDLDKIQKLIVSSAIEQISKKLISKKQVTLEKIRLIIVKHFYENPVVISLLSDDPHGLRAEMGLPREKSDEVLGEITHRLLESIDIDIQKSMVGNTGNITTRLYSNVKPSDLLSVPGATYPSNKYTIPWLDWILNHAGQFVLTTSHNIVTDSDSVRKSRSHLAIMVKSKVAWKVPSWVSFPGNKNFIEKIMEDVEIESKKLIEESF